MWTLWNTPDLARVTFKKLVEKHWLKKWREILQNKYNIVI